MCSNKPIMMPEAMIQAPPYLGPREYVYKDGDKKVRLDMYSHSIPSMT